MVLSDTEIREIEKGLDFPPIQNKINEPGGILKNLSMHTFKITL